MLYDTCRFALYRKKNANAVLINDVEHIARTSGTTFNLFNRAFQDVSLCDRGHTYDDDTASLSSVSRDNFSYPIPLAVKKINVCRDTGETVLHKAARNGYYVRCGIISELCKARSFCGMKRM